MVNERRPGLGGSTKSHTERTPLVLRLRGLLDRRQNADSSILGQYFEAPPQNFLDRFKDTRVRYVGASMPSEDKYRQLLINGSSTNPNREGNLSTIRRVAAIRYLIDRIEKDFGGRSIAIQGVACSIGGRIDLPHVEGLPELEVRNIWRLISPAAYDAPMPPPIDIPLCDEPLSQQGLSFFDFMYASAAHTRERALAKQKPLIFPAAVIYDLEKIRYEKEQRAPTKDRTCTAMQARSFMLPVGRSAREEAVLGLYVVDFPRYILPPTPR